MKVVGVRELKAKLSQYLRDVQRGDVFLVTDRDRVVAELRPPGSVPAQVDDDTAWRLQRLADDGEVRPPVTVREGWSWRPAGLGLADGTADRVLNADREERGI